VYKQGRRHFTAHMTVFYLAQEQGQGTRVGFTVGRVLGGSVVRNRIKRRLREAVRMEGLQANFPADVVINPKRSLLAVEFAALREEVRRAFLVVEQKLRERRTP
jgi:ribonuclease P protein component